MIDVVDRTREDLRHATAAALARCVTPREATDDHTVLNLNVLEEEAPIHSTPRYRERPRFRQPTSGKI